MHTAIKQCLREKTGNSYAENWKKILFGRSASYFPSWPSWIWQWNCPQQQLALLPALILTTQSWWELTLGLTREIAHLSPFFEDSVTSMTRPRRGRRLASVGNRCGPAWRGANTLCHGRRWCVIKPNLRCAGRKDGCALALPNPPIPPPPLSPSVLPLCPVQVQPDLLGQKHHSSSS